MSATALLLLVLAAGPADTVPAQAAPDAKAKAPATRPAGKPQPGDAGLETERDRTLYALGVAAADSFKVFNLKPEELAVVQRGLSDAVLGKKIQVDMGVYRSKVNELASSSYGDRSRAALVHFSKEKGAQRSPSGLIFISSREGTGPSPGPGDRVKINYEGKLADGSIFDSSKRQGGPVVAGLAESIPCFREGMQKMKAGGQARIICPASIAYGEKGKPPTVPPNSTLIFDVDLIAIESVPGAAPAAAPAPAPAAAPAK